MRKYFCIQSFKHFLFLYSAINYICLLLLLIKIFFMNINELLLPFGLTLFAGLSTGIGSAIAFFAKTTNTKFLSISLGFSAGVMFMCPW